MSDPALVRFAAAEARGPYAAHCASCHGRDLKGDSSRGAPNLVDADWLYGSGHVQEIERTILYGVRSGDPKSWNLAEMPAFGEPHPSRQYKEAAHLTPPEIDDLVAYLQLLQDSKVDGAAAARGVKLFANRAQCFDCHGADARGDASIGAPNLTDAIWLYGTGSAQDMRRALTHGHHGSCPAWITRLSGHTIRSLAVYIRSLGPGPTSNEAF